MIASRDCGEIDLGVVDAVEDVREDDGCEGQADLDQLRVAIARRLDRSEILVAYGATGFREVAYEAGQSIAFGIACGLAVANVLELVGLQSCELAEQAVRSLTVIAAGDAADDQLDRLLITLAQRM
jgi:hypothetical protein